MPETNDVISHLYYDLNDKIDNLTQRLTETEDNYYTNSYVERLKALGSDVQYSNSMGGGISAFNMTDNQLTLFSIFINKATTITGTSFTQITQGNYTEDNYNGIGLYSYDLANQKLILVASTPDDGDIWKTASNTYATKDFTTPVTISIGIYYIGLLYNNSAQVTAPTILSNNSQTTLGGILNTTSLTSAKLNGHVLAQNALPAEILNADILQGQTYSCILNLY